MRERGDGDRGETGGGGHPVGARRENAVPPPAKQTQQKRAEGERAEGARLDEDEDRLVVRMVDDRLDPIAAEVRREVDLLGIALRREGDGEAAAAGPPRRVDERQF